MKIFFTSDTFFGRKSIAHNRGFSSVDEMDDTLIDNWNRRVGKNDVVYHLGNFSWDPISAESSIIHLQGRIHFIGGSYDQHLSENSLIKAGRHFLLPAISYIPKDLIVLSHWPLLDWPEREVGSIHVHGGSVKTDTIKGHVRFNANTENWAFAPIELDTLKDILELEKNQ